VLCWRPAASNCGTPPGVVPALPAHLGGQCPGQQRNPPSPRASWGLVPLPLPLGTETDTNRTEIPRIRQSSRFRAGRQLFPSGRGGNWGRVEWRDKPLGRRPTAGPTGRSSSGEREGGKEERRKEGRSRLSEP